MNLSFVCTQCGKKTPITTHAPRCQCGGLFELDFQAPDWDEKLLDKTQWNLFRYRAFMALDDDHTWRDITMGEGMTPIIRFNDDVMFKMDYTMLNTGVRLMKFMLNFLESINLDALLFRRQRFTSVV